MCLFIFLWLTFWLKCLKKDKNAIKISEEHFGMPRWSCQDHGRHLVGQQHEVGGLHRRQVRWKLSTQIQKIKRRFFFNFYLQLIAYLTVNSAKIMNAQTTIQLCLLKMISIVNLIQLAKYQITLFIVVESIVIFWFMLSFLLCTKVITLNYFCCI